MKNWNVFDGKKFIKMIRARDYERALRAADAMGARKKLRGPMVVVPADERVRVNAYCN